MNHLHSASCKLGCVPCCFASGDSQLAINELTEHWLCASSCAGSWGPAYFPVLTLFVTVYDF